MNNKKVELGDGEPSPGPGWIEKAAEKIAQLQHMGIERGLELRQHKIEDIIDNFWKYSGAAQEVSPPSPDAAHIWDSITRVAESRHDYGVCTLTRSACQKLIGERLHGGDTRELKAALEHATCCADPDCMACLEYHNKFIRGM